MTNPTPITLVDANGNDIGPFSKLQVTGSITVERSGSTARIAISSDGSGTGVTVQPAIANVNRTGLATEQITKLQDKVDEILVALRGAGVIAA